MSINTCRSGSQSDCQNGSQSDCQSGSQWWFSVVEVLVKGVIEGDGIDN